jgi:hypothetical protein
MSSSLPLFLAPLEKYMQNEVLRNLITVAAITIIFIAANGFIQKIVGHEKDPVAKRYRQRKEKEAAEKQKQRAEEERRERAGESKED